MTTHKKLDALKNNLNAYVSLYAAGLTVQADGMREAIDLQLSTLLEENERLLKVNDESAHELMDMLTIKSIIDEKNRALDMVRKLEEINADVEEKLADNLKMDKEPLSDEYLKKRGRALAVFGFELSAFILGAREAEFARGIGVKK